jgi:predicted AAA+ superfamily ATPase
MWTFRAFASDDPRAFLAHHGRKTIIDEAQRVPELFSYIQGIVDESGEPGQFVVSGSQNFLLMEAIDQSLAGRVAVLNLLPLSLAELDAAGLAPATIDEWLFAGGYPRIYDHGIDPADYYPNYIRTYIERDVRTTTGITKLADFERLLGLCVARTSEALNIQALSRDCGVAINNRKGVALCARGSFLICLLRPYHHNLGKRITKRPKLHLLDQGLASNLIGLEEVDDVAPARERRALRDRVALGGGEGLLRNGAYAAALVLVRFLQEEDRCPCREGFCDFMGHRGEGFFHVPSEVLPSPGHGWRRSWAFPLIAG